VDVRHRTVSALVESVCVCVDVSHRNVTAAVGSVCVCGCEPQECNCSSSVCVCVDVSHVTVTAAVRSVCVDVSHIFSKEHQRRQH